MILLCDGDQPVAAGWNVAESVRSRFAYRDLLKQPMSGQRGLSNSAEMRG